MPMPDGGCLATLAMHGLELRVRVDADGQPTIVKCVWQPPKLPSVKQRRQACEACPHKASIGELTVQCKLCGCGGLRLDGPAAGCRAGKWTNESE